MKNGFGLH